jgi:hypothetical protein
LSEKKLIEYIHDIEGILFDSSDQDEDKSIFDVDEVKFIMFTQKILHNLLPSWRNFILLKISVPLRDQISRKF